MVLHVESSTPRSYWPRRKLLTAQGRGCTSAPPFVGLGFTGRLHGNSVGHVRTAVACCCSRPATALSLQHAAAFVGVQCKQKTSVVCPLGFRGPSLRGSASQCTLFLHFTHFNTILPLCFCASPCLPLTLCLYDSGIWWRRRA